MTGMPLFVSRYVGKAHRISLYEHAPEGAPECQKSWWGQAYVVGIICYPFTVLNMIYDTIS